ncbi:MAG: glycine-rich protein [Gammaproteobacteria bacterium]
MYKTSLRLTLVVASVIYASSGSAAWQDATWTNVAGVSVATNDLTKTAATGWGNAGTFSVESIPGDGGCRGVPQETNKARFIGLSPDDPDKSYSSIDFGLNAASNGNLIVYENGASRGSFGAYNVGDTISVERVGTTVYYKKNGTTVYTSTVSSSATLYCDTAFNHNGARLFNVQYDSGDTELPVWYSNGSYIAGAQGTSGATDLTMDISLQPAGNTCNQLGGDGGLACRTDNVSVNAVRIFYAQETSVPVDGSCSDDVDRASASYQDFSSSPETSTSLTMTYLTANTRYCFEATLVDGFGNISSEGIVEVAGMTLQQNQQVFSYTGSQQTWIVPAGVTSVNIQAEGAASYKPATPAEISEGGDSKATFSVTTGEMLYVYVGGKGVKASDAPSGNYGGGGFNGGGQGGKECTSGSLATNGYGGGGASDVRQGGNALANRLIVAGGGGGGSWNYAGGSGGGTSGNAGNNCWGDGSNCGGAGGGEGTQSAGGTKQGSGSTNGSLGQGGQGGYLNGQNRCGGGGGGGYYGGGGGGYGTTKSARGGGGGSGYVAPSGTNSLMAATNGRGYANGQVIISWPVAVTSSPLKGAIMIVN